MLEFIGLVTANHLTAEYTIPMPPSFPSPWRASAAALTVAWLSFFLALPAHGDALTEAQRLLDQGQIPAALTRVDSHLASKPGDAQGRFLRGLILSRAGRANEAIAVFTSLSEDYPDLPEPYNNLAVLYAQQKQYEQARAVLETAVRVHPGYAVAHENLGDVYVQLASDAYPKAAPLEGGTKRLKTKLNLARELLGQPATAPASSLDKPGVR